MGSMDAVIAELQARKADYQRKIEGIDECCDLLRTLTDASSAVVKKKKNRRAKPVERDEKRPVKRRERATETGDDGNPTLIHAIEYVRENPGKQVNEVTEALYFRNKIKNKISAGMVISHAVRSGRIRRDAHGGLHAD